MEMPGRFSQAWCLAWFLASDAFFPLGMRRWTPKWSQVGPLSFSASAFPNASKARSGFDCFDHGWDSGLQVWRQAPLLAELS